MRPQYYPQQMRYPSSEIFQIQPTARPQMTGPQVNRPGITKPIVQISPMKPNEEVAKKSTLVSISLHKKEDDEKKDDSLKRSKPDS